MAASTSDKVPRAPKSLRLSIADLMFAVLLMALASALLALVGGSRLRGDEQLFCYLLTALAMLFLYLQWPLAGARQGGEPSWLSVFIGLLSLLMAVITMVCLALLFIALPEASVVVILMMITLVLYLVAKG